MTDKLDGRIVTVANGHLSYEVFNASATLVPVLAELLQQRFGLNLASRPVAGLSEVVAEVECDGVKLGLGWDNWSGAYVMAFCSRGDAYIDKIATYLRAELCAPHFLQYLDEAVTHDHDHTE